MNDVKTVTAGTRSRSALTTLKMKVQTCRAAIRTVPTRASSAAFLRVMVESMNVTCPIRNLGRGCALLDSSMAIRTIRNTIRRICLVLCLAAIAVHADANSLDATAASSTAPVIVIGFAGGFVRHDASVHGAVQLVERLKRDYPSGVYAQALENHHGGEAYAEIMRRLDSDHDGSVSDEEKRNARIILYGHSWGASESITLARELGKQGIPVLLTVQVDSVSKPGQNDQVIPANVAEAANFYQLDGFVHGQRQISAADPSRTHIIGNFRFDYKAHPIDCKDYPWYDLVFMKPHTEIECDPKVWTQVEALIQSRLPSHE